ncbi:2,3-diphosphoglycerate-dependent phosphoglycerate mutase [Fructilactobacillus myrtifloralis]|uniref:2,3-bisphosphoglycerate-dependent phosphoglycerate mutase n=1 Tax=Fructilactobacillus myrtifloralis TaxID=2940301 RepID=A0ABY5BMS3_9LACO|nr:2,3-diphosphoglycerate-dependent phosphoglycerate mutase [Fructilactobacillus myrtifloralis]USS84902.1 2,3-diphosphoglycerate-dependent phosphoglycerate mutase [Fructilactobacillus myrtifloralis]
MTKLVLIRHGESIANQQHVFTGWNDVALTEQGQREAVAAGAKLNQLHLAFGAVHTSYLKRAIQSANIVLDELDQLWIPQYKTWRLNERHYGALRGRKKPVVREEVGEDQFMQWRRSFTAVPPRLDWVTPKRRYARIGVREPRAESLQMAYERLIPYWQDQLAPRLLQHQNQLVVAHGSSLRALIKYLEQLSDDAIDGVEVPNAEPIVYTLDEHLHIQQKQILA